MKAYMIKPDNTNNNEKFKYEMRQELTSIALSTLLPAVSLAKEFYDKSNTIFLTFDQAKHYINAANTEWNPRQVYFEHPLKSNILIPKEIYKDYVLGEMVSDIASYIMDHLPITELTVGIVSSKKAGLGASINVKKITAHTKFNCELAKKYISHFENCEQIKTKDEYYWIMRFPELKAAIEHNAKVYDNVRETTLELDVDVNIAKKIGGRISGSKVVQLFINYKV